LATPLNLENFRLSPQAVAADTAPMQQEKAHHHLPRKLHAMAMTRSTMKEVGDSNPGGVTVRGVVMGGIKNQRHLPHPLVTEQDSAWTPELLHPS